MINIILDFNFDVISKTCVYNPKYIRYDEVNHVIKINQDLSLGYDYLKKVIDTSYSYKYLKFEDPKRLLCKIYNDISNSVKDATIENRNVYISVHELLIEYANMNEEARRKASYSSNKLDMTKF